MNKIVGLCLLSVPPLATIAVRSGFTESDALSCPVLSCASAATVHQDPF